MRRIPVGFHPGCPDGFTALAISKMKLGDMMEPIPMSPNEETLISTIEKLQYPTDTEMYIYDVSFTPRSLECLINKYPNARIFDHHKTTLECFKTSPSCAKNIVFDLDRSGAMLAWNHLYPSDPAPLIVSYVQDRDLYKHALPSSREINAWFWNNYRCEYDDIHRWIALLRNSDWVTDAIREGGIYVRSQRSLMNDILRMATYHILDLGDLGTYSVACAESALFRSDLGAALYNRENAPCDFALIWRVDLISGKVLISLRSKSCDVEAIARMWGGGGHKHAAGCEMGVGEFFKLLGKI